MVSSSSCLNTHYSFVIFKVISNSCFDSVGRITFVPELKTLFLFQGGYVWITSFSKATPCLQGQPTEELGKLIESKIKLIINILRVWSRVLWEEEFSFQVRSVIPSPASTHHTYQLCGWRHKIELVFIREWGGGTLSQEQKQVHFSRTPDTGVHKCAWQRDQNFTKKPCTLPPADLTSILAFSYLASQQHLTLDQFFLLNSLCLVLVALHSSYFPSNFTNSPKITSYYILIWLVIS